MTTLLIHFVLLGWISLTIARRLTDNVIDRIIAAAMLMWGHIVLLSLLLSQLGKLGDAVWFFRSSLILGFLSVLLVRRFVSPAPAIAEKPSGEKASWALLVTVVGSLFIMFVVNIRVAASYPPNNFDSLTYHLPRAMYYLGHNTLAQFESIDIRQTFFSFNYNLLQLFCFIYGPPHEVTNFINVIAWGIAGLGIYRVSRLCGCSANASLIATWLALTANQVIAQATTTTLDLATAAALFAAIGFGLRWRQSTQSRDAILAGIAAGIAAGAKLTVVFFGPTVVLLLMVFWFQHWQQGATRSFSPKSGSGSSRASWPPCSACPSSSTTWLRPGIG